MIKERSLARRVYIEPFQWAVNIAVGPEELLWFLRTGRITLGIDTDTALSAVCGLCQPCQDEYGAEFTLLYFSEDSLDSDTIGHECLHLVHQILDSRGVPISMDNTELMAYMQEYVVYEVKKVLVHRGHLPKGSAKRTGRITV